MSTIPPNAHSNFQVKVDSEVLRRIRQHARSSMRAEVCGVLIGCVRDGFVVVQASIAGEKAAQGGAHVTFTQETWAHIYKEKDKDHPDKSIVGWYHSHPGFGVFLSDHDLFIHENFFSAPYQLAWVFDPHSDEEGCFGWRDGKTRRLKEITILTCSSPELDANRQEPPRSLPVPVPSQRTNAAKPTTLLHLHGHKSRVVPVLARALLFAALAFAVSHLLTKILPSLSGWKVWGIAGVFGIAGVAGACWLARQFRRAQKRPEPGAEHKPPPAVLGKSDSKGPSASGEKPKS